MVSMPKILVIEDEGAVRAGLVDGLSLEGYEVVHCEDGPSGLDCYRDSQPDLVILDLMMPGLDGLEVCRRIRADSQNTPIIILTAKTSEVDKVVGLELGADDYLTKPFGMRELYARVKTQLRKRKLLLDASINGHAPAPTNGANGLEELAIGEVHIDFRTYRAKRGAQELSLSAKEYDLLKFLASRPDVPVSRDELLDQVWGYNNYPTTRTVDNFIARLRQKIEAVPERPRHLLTVHGVGYKFVR